MSENLHHGFNYIELPAVDLAAMKAFYGQAFDWTFQDWGDVYVAIQGAGIEGGFDKTMERKPTRDGVLVILYSKDLIATQKSVEKAGGTISVAPFDFPGGRRFHFVDPSGNELAVWTPG